MKEGKVISCSIEKKFVIHFLFSIYSLLVGTTFSQTTIFSENMGTPSGTTAIASNTFQNASLTFSGTGDIRSTSTSSGYTGSSAAGNVYLTNTVGKNFEIASIVTTSYSSLSLSFGAFKSTTASTMSELTLEYSTNGSSYTAVTIPAQASGTGTAIWRLITVSLPVGAEGASNLRLKWTNTSATPQFRIDDVTLTGNQSTTGSSPTGYFRSLVTGNWNTAGNWQSSDDNSTWVTSTLVPTSSAAFITVQSGHTVTINADATASTLTINGTLSFDANSNRLFSVTGDITISSTGKFHCPNSGGYAYLTTTGNIINNNILDFYTTAQCDVTFNKNGNQTISGIGGTTKFNIITVDMGTSNANILEIMPSNFSTNTECLHYSSTTANELKNGTIKFSGTYTFSNDIFYPGKSHEILSTCGLWLNNPNATITATMDSWDVSGILRITQGIMNVGTGAGNSVRTKGTNAQIIIEGGTLTIAGRIAPTTANSNQFTYNQSGGIVTVCTVGSASSSIAAFDMSKSSSSFTMTGGTIIIRNKTSNACDFYNPAGTSSVTGGTIQFGDASTSNAQIFTINSSVDLPNLIVSNATSQATKPKLLLASNIAIKLNLTIMSSTVLDVSSDGGTTSFDISIKGDWINNGTFTSRNKTVTFNGIASQDLSGSTTTGFYNVTMNNTSVTGLTFSKDATVAGALTLTDGIIYTSNPNYLTMNTGSTSTSGSSASFVDGPMKKIGSTNFVFPVGDGIYWRRVGISSLTGSETFTAHYFHTAYTDVSSMKPETDPLSWVSNQEYWTVSRAATIDAVVELYWEDATASSLPACTDLRIAHWDGTNNYWEKANQDEVTTTGFCTGTSAGTIYSNADLVEFSPFTFGGVTIITLPISLVSFDATLENRKVKLSWITETEVNNDYFTIEKTVDGINFEFVAKIDGAGNHQETLHYTVMDENPYNGISYYRLKQTDYSGKSETFPLRTISHLGSSSDKLAVYPNPISKDDYMTINVPGEKNDQADLQITDVLGQVFYSKSVILNQKNEQLTFPLPETICTGMYIVSIASEGKLCSEKLIVK